MSLESKRAMTAVEKRQMDAVINRAREFVRTADEFFPEYPETLSEPLQHLTEALDRLGRPEWERMSFVNAGVPVWICSGCRLALNAWSEPEPCACGEIAFPPILEPYDP